MCATYLNANVRSIRPWDQLCRERAPLIDKKPRGFNWTTGQPLAVLLVDRGCEDELIRLLNDTLVTIGSEQSASQVAVRVIDSAEDALQQIRQKKPNLVAISGGNAIVVQRLLRHSDCSLLILPERSLDAKKAKTQTILVPVDFSPESYAGAMFAIDLAQRSEPPRPRVELLRLYQVTPGYHRAGWTYEQFADRLRTVNEESMDAFVRGLGQNHGNDLITRCLETKHAARAVTALVENRGYGQLVIGSRSRTWLTGLLMPSFTNRVVLSASVPTWVVRDAVNPLGLAEAMWSR